MKTALKNWDGGRAGMPNAPEICRLTPSGCCLLSRCHRQGVSLPNIASSLVEMPPTSSSSPSCPGPRRLAGRWEAPSHARALPPHYLMDPPRLRPGLFTDPHYFQSPSLVKSNLATYYRPDKTALGSAGPHEGPGSFQTFIPPLPPCGLPSLRAELLSKHAAGRSQPQLAAFAKGQEF